MKPIRIVAIDTSSRIGSVAVATDGRLLESGQFQTQHNHAVELLPTIVGLCQSQGWAATEIDHLYVSRGPGSFTGLRIAMTVARTLGWSTSLEIVAVPTMQVLARNALRHDPIPQHLGVLLDAKRRQVYAASFALSDGEARPIEDPAVVDPAAFVEALPAPRWILGEGIPYHQDAISGFDYRAVPDALWQPRAEEVLYLGWKSASNGETTAPSHLGPLYLRLPEAEEVWRQRQAEQA
jgi:tRNA threonylcarbamoyladenosine biosynthesis protein TsaB